MRAEPICRARLQIAVPEGGHAAPDGCLSCNIAQVAALLRPASRLKCVWPPCPHHAGQTEAVISPFAMGANHADSNQTSCCSTPRGTEGHQMATHEEVCPCSPEVNKCTCAVFCGMLLCWCAWSCMAADVSETDRHIHVSLLLHAISYSAEYADLHTPLWHLPVPRHSRGSDGTPDLQRRARRQEICIRVCKSQEGTCSPGRHGPPGSASSGQKRFCYQAMRACTAIAVGPFAHSQ